MIEYIKNIERGASSILEGMAITFSWLFRRPCTIQWPDKIEKPLEETLPERTRGLLEVDLRLCTGCTACQKACPIDVIEIGIEKNDETKQRFIVNFSIEAAKCMYCGLCTEACPTDAIRHTTQFAMSTNNIDNLFFEFVKTGEKIVPYKPKDDKPDLKARGSIVLEAYNTNVNRNKEVRQK